MQMQIQIPSQVSVNQVSGTYLQKQKFINSQSQCISLCSSSKISQTCYLNNKLTEQQKKNIENQMMELNQEFKKQPKECCRYAQIKKIICQMNFYRQYGIKLSIQTQLHLNKQELNYLFIQVSFQQKLKFLLNIINQFKDSEQTFAQQPYDFEFNFSQRRLKQVSILSNKELVTAILSCIYIGKQNKYKVFKIVKKHLLTLQNTLSQQLQERLFQQVWRYIIDSKCSIQVNRSFVQITIHLFLQKIDFDCYKEKVRAIIQDYSFPILKKQIYQDIKQMKIKKVFSFQNLSRSQMNCQKISDIDRYSNSFQMQSVRNELKILQRCQLSQIKQQVSKQYHRFLKLFYQAFGVKDILLLSQSEQITQNQLTDIQFQLLQCFCYKKSYLKYFKIQQFLKQNWSSIEVLDFSDSRLGTKHIEQILQGNWKHLQGFLAYGNKITTLQNCNLHQLQNVTFLSFSYNLLDSSSVKYLISHQWPNLIELRISFIDGNQSWSLLLDHIRQCFPNLKYLGVRQAGYLTEQIIQYINSFENRQIPLEIGFDE